MADRVIPLRTKTVTEKDRETYQRELAKIGRVKGDLQLTFFNDLAANTPPAYTNIFEFFDAIPKFVLTPHSSFRKSEGLEIKKFEFKWGDAMFHIAISPVVLESRHPETKQSVRKEILPGPREETIYRVLKKMAADATVERRARERSVVLRFTLHNLRRRLSDVGHEFKVVEMKEALQVLAQSPIKVRYEHSKKELYSGTYISLLYVTDENDPTGERSLVEVSFNELAAAAVTAQLYDRIHYTRLMSLSPLAAWIYELLTRNFRQAGADCGFKLSLSRILRESGLPAAQDLRRNLRSVRKALKELVEKGVLAMFPAIKESVQLEAAGQRAGRRKIEDVIWIVYPSNDVASDIRSDNAAQATRRERNADRRHLAIG